MLILKGWFLFFIITVISGRTNIDLFYKDVKIINYINFKFYYYSRNLAPEQCIGGGSGGHGDHQ